MSEWLIAGMHAGFRLRNGPKSPPILQKVHPKESPFWKINHTGDVIAIIHLDRRFSKDPDGSEYLNIRYHSHAHTHTQKATTEKTSSMGPHPKEILAGVQL
jgi:hypothetical protein